MPDRAVMVYTDRRGGESHGEQVQHRKRSGPVRADQRNTRQLRELEGDGFLHRKAYGEAPPRVEYRLTALGESFAPLLGQMLAWSETNLCPLDYVNPYREYLKEEER